MVNHADIVNRIVAIIIDSIILWIVMMVIALPLGVQAMLLGSFNDPMAAASLWASTAIFALVAILVNLGYFVYFEGTTGQTVGKKIMNIKVVKENGKPMTYVDALIRTILRIIDALPAFYILGLILIVASKENQRLGDMAAKTFVVRA